ncbi:MAG: leader peptidase (prepilin peptidase)/N-methyltransferase [Gammaproteobacteria bacterium]|jgi:leader peptidase (prepilin peptidase) / N-methyltransferase
MPAIYFLQTQPLFFIFMMTMLGMCIGSFLNVVIYRLPKMMQQDWHEQCCELLDIKNQKREQQTNLIFPRSSCPACQHKISTLENIPVISYLFLKGRCRSCNIKISLQYPLIEIFTGLTTAYIAWHFGFSLQALFAALLTWALISLSMIDLEHSLLPDDITLPFMWLGLACSIFGVFTDITSSLIGAMLGYSILWLIFMSFKVITGKEGMGYGDFKLLALLGAWLGWQSLPLIILLSSITATIIGIAMILFKGRDKAAAFPFGPYLAISGWITLFWGEELIGTYQTIF